MNLGNVIVLLFLFSTCSLYGQKTDKVKCEKPKHEKPVQKNWSLSVSSGYINIPAPTTSFSNNLWGSANISYSKKNWSTTLWIGSNYWLENRKVDLRLGVTTTYTIIKW